jgi:hypothetical protein
VPGVEQRACAAHGRLTIAGQSPTIRRPGRECHQALQAHRAGLSNLLEMAVEKKFNAPVDKVFALLTDPKWLEARSLAIGELSASVKAKKAGTGVTLNMKRRVHRELNAMISKVLSPDSDIELDEKWSADGDRRTGNLTLQIVGKPITVTGDFELAPEGKGCVYRIQHYAKVKVPFIGGVVEKFVIGQTEQGCADELDYLADYLKKNK